MTRDWPAIERTGMLKALRLIDALPPELYDMGLAWYPQVHDMIKLWAIETGHSQEVVAAILALYSQNQRWCNNKVLARKALYDGIVNGMPRVIANVNRVLALPPRADSESVYPCLTNGRKTHEFYWSLLDVASCACDRWMFDVWGLRQYDRFYNYVVKGVTLVADTLGVPVHHAQAVIWIARLAQERPSTRTYCP